MPRGLIGKRAAGVAAKPNNVALRQQFQRVFDDLPQYKLTSDNNVLAVTFGESLSVLRWVRQSELASEQQWVSQ